MFFSLIYWTMFISYICINNFYFCKIVIICAFNSDCTQRKLRLADAFKQIYLKNAKLVKMNQQEVIVYLVWTLLI